MRSVESLQSARAFPRLSKQFDSAAIAYREVRAAHWDGVAAWAETKRGLGGTYHRRLKEVFGFFCPPGLRVLEIGGGTVDGEDDELARFGDGGHRLRGLFAPCGETSDEHEDPLRRHGPTV